jgi:hypothetical protein
MKKNLKVLLYAFATMSLFTFGWCDNIVDVVYVDYSGNTTMELTAKNAAGTHSFSKEKITNGFSDFLSSKGISAERLKTVELKAVTLTIPSDVNIDFSIVDEVSFTVNNVEWAKLVVPANTVGKTLKLGLSKVDVRSLLEASAALDIKLSVKTKGATPAFTMPITYDVTIGYEVL